jgi:tRNA nucleotidyltransferase (CCA-adding enzyme)
MTSNPLINEIFRQEISEIIPTPTELKKFADTISFLQKIIQESQLPQDISIKFIEPQGSTGIKNTALKNAADIDLFIGIDPNFIFQNNFKSKKVRREFLHKLFKNLATEWIIPLLKENNVEQIELTYSEHPYVSVVFNDIEIDVVICFDLSADYIYQNGPITAVDRSPHHSRYIRDNLTEHQKNEVRLLKHLFKAYNCYGDKSAIGQSGFIGYSAELLIDHYQTIENLFKNFQDLIRKIIYPKKFASLGSEIQNRYQNLDYLQIKDKYFPNDYLILLDPTDINRNVGSSISIRAFLFLQEKIKIFIKNPSTEFFKKHLVPKITEMELPKPALKKFYYVEYVQTQEDHYTKFRDKLHSLMNKFIAKALRESTPQKRFENVIGEILFDATKGIYAIALFTKTPLISQEYIRKGPKIGDEPHYTTFKEKHTECFEEKNFLWLKMRRKHTEFRTFLNDFQKHSIKYLEVKKMGCANDENISDFANRSMGNLNSILPFIF